jgi:hypothetical protein
MPHSLLPRKNHARGLARNDNSLILSQAQDERVRTARGESRFCRNPDASGLVEPQRCVSD